MYFLVPRPLRYATPRFLCLSTRKLTTGDALGTSAAAGRCWNPFGKESGGNKSGAKPETNTILAAVFEPKTDVHFQLKYHGERKNEFRHGVILYRFEFPRVSFPFPYPLLFPFTRIKCQGSSIVSR